MSTVINSTLSQVYTQQQHKETILSRFMKWCDAQQEQRLLWVGLALAIHGCFLTPITILIIGATGFSFSLIMTSLAAMTLALVVNLAALPTRITIPALLLSIVIDVAIVVAIAL